MLDRPPRKGARSVDAPQGAAKSMPPNLGASRQAQAERTRRYRARQRDGIGVAMITYTSQAGQGKSNSSTSRAPPTRSGSSGYLSRGSSRLRYAHG
jgi:hypothetical protein